MITDAWAVAAEQTGSDPSITNSRLFALNNNGVAVGMANVSSVYRAITYQFNGAPVPVLPAGNVAVDINDAGWIAGWFKNSANIEQGFVADAGGTITVIPSPDPAINCRPVRLSQFSTSGMCVAGNCAGNRPYRNRLADSAAQELSYPGSSNLGIVSINSRGEAAGTAVRPGAYAPDGYTALLWSTDPTSPTDLNACQAFAPASAWNVHATDINEAGTVLTGYTSICR